MVNAFTQFIFHTRIFLEYLNGKSCKGIAKGLEEDGILTVRGNTKWHDSVIRRILSNEKYMGDALLQKTYTVDFLKKKRSVNNGEMPKYYIEDNHEPIISKDIFMMVQKETARRSSLKNTTGNKRSFSSTHSFSGIVYCAGCGALYNRVHWYNHGKKSVVWRCSTRLHSFEKCSARTIHETALHEAFGNAVNQLISGKDEYIKMLRENISESITGCSPLITIDNRLSVLEHELLEHSENYAQIADEILELRQKRTQLQIEESTAADRVDRMKEIMEFLKSASSGITEFDEVLARRLVEKITVFDERVVFEFKSGAEVVVVG